MNGESVHKFFFCPSDKRETALFLFFLQNCLEELVMTDEKRKKKIPVQRISLTIRNGITSCILSTTMYPHCRF